MVAFRLSQGKGEKGLIIYHLPFIIYHLPLIIYHWFVSGIAYPARKTSRGLLFAIHWPPALNQ